MRATIVANHAKLQTMLDGFKSQGLEFDYSESLKRNPRGFEKLDDEALQRLVRLKHHTFVREIANKDITTPKIADALIELTHITLPFLEFGWAAIDPVREEEALKNAS
jgi:uncharacterized protein (DUF2461 family)